MKKKKEEKKQNKPQIRWEGEPMGEEILNVVDYCISDFTK